MSKKIDEIIVTTGKELVEKERKRLLRLKKSDPKWWKSEGRSEWARKRFGKTLKEKDGVVYPSGLAFNGHVCNVCGGIPDIEEKIIRLIFSFCDEYRCDMNICKDCLETLYNKLITKKGDKK